MPIRKNTRSKLDELLSSGARPEKMKTTEGLGVRSGRRMIPLTDAAGNKTIAGIYWEQNTHEPLQEAGFLQQQVVREGNTETIKLRDGKRGVTRR